MDGKPEKPKKSEVRHRPQDGVRSAADGIGLHQMGPGPDLCLRAVFCSGRNAR